MFSIIFGRCFGAPCPQDLLFPFGRTVSPIHDYRYETKESWCWGVLTLRVLWWQGRAWAILHILVYYLGLDNVLKKEPGWFHDCLIYHIPWSIRALALGPFPGGLTHTVLQLSTALLRDRQREFPLN